MNKKIKFLEEILQLDKASKLFYRLAALYVAREQYIEAAQVLETGLLSNSEHLEAKFLYAIVLTKLDQQEKLTKLLNDITDRFQQYSEFFILWGKNINFTNKNKDLSLIISLLATILSGKRLDFTGILMRGLQHDEFFEKSILEANVFNESDDDFEENIEEGSLDELTKMAPTKTMAELFELHGEYRQAYETYKILCVNATEDDKILFNEKMHNLNQLLSKDGLDDFEPIQVIDKLETLALKLEERVKYDEKN